MYLELIIAALETVFAIFYISISWLEKQHIRQFIPAPREQGEDASPYFTAMNEAARRLGFHPAGVFIQHRSSRVYQARLALWISPDRQLLVQIGGGKTAGLPIKRTNLISFLEPGRILQTSDDFDMPDLSGLTDRKVLVNAHLEELLACHKDRLAKHPGTMRLFSPVDALVAQDAMQAMKAAQMAKLGLAKFVNVEHTVWRHTFKGAWLNFYRGFQKQWAEAQAKKDRISLKRPGQK